LVRGCKVPSGRKHAATQELLAAAIANLLRPLHPAWLAEAEEIPGILLTSQPQVVKAKKHHARRPVRSLKRRLPRQRKVRHPFIQPWTKIRSLEVLPSVFPVERRNASLSLQHFARPTVNFPTDIK